MEIFYSWPVTTILIKAVTWFILPRLRMRNTLSRAKK
jgi:hypothetical protein